MQRYRNQHIAFGDDFGAGAGHEGGEIGCYFGMISKFHTNNETPCHAFIHESGARHFVGRRIDLCVEAEGIFAKIIGHRIAGALTDGTLDKLQFVPALMADTVHPRERSLANDTGGRQKYIDERIIGYFDSELHVSILPFMERFVSQNFSKDGDRRTPPEIFDRQLIRIHRSRAAADFAAHDILARYIADELIGRLEAVTRDFSDALIIGAPRDVLSSGEFASRLASKVSRITYVDSARQMLPGHGVRLVCDEERLPFCAPRFDLIISFWTLHLVNDVPGVLRQYRTILHPNGLLLAGLAGGETLIELRESLNRAESEITGGLAPHIHPFAELRSLGDLLPRAGFALPVADSVRITINYRSPLALMADLRGMGEANALVARPRRGLRRDVLARAFEFYQEAYGLANQRYPARFDIHYLTGWAPHPDQQQPLKPGSGQTSLAEIFKDTI